MPTDGLSVRQEERSESAGFRQRQRQRQPQKQQSSKQAQSKQHNGVPAPPPEQPPPFTVADIRAAVPKHCFQRSILRSSLYVLSDIAKAVALFYLATWIGSHPALPAWAPYVLWPAYWVVQGTVLTGIWVLAHECGHQAFSDYKWLNNSVGLVLHTALLVPFHSWRISHSNHHKNTCSLDNDEVHVPPTRSVVGDMVEETPLFNLIHIVLMLTIGWPLYLTFNATGPPKYKGKQASHFLPSSAIFQPRDYLDILVSVLALAAMFTFLGYLTLLFGLKAIVVYYGIPYLIVNYHLVLITYLQHTDEYIPYYRKSQFTWLRGALSTVDRSFGALVDYQLHHIADTHVAHHLFSTMPHYHAQEATAAIRKLLGPYYLKDDRRIWSALWSSWTKCRFVEDEGGRVFYQAQL